MKQVKAKILSREEVAEGRFKIRLEAPSICKDAKAGQFVMIKCSEGLEPFLRRPFSFHNIKKKSFELLYQVVGEGTRILSQRKVDETLDVIGPLGNGFELLSSILYPPFSILVAGGIGVAPLLELARQLIAHNLEFTVLIGARTKEHILCEEDFKKLGAKVRVSTEDGSKGYRGLVTDLLKGEFQTLKTEVRTTIYACGPKEMLKEMAGLAKSNKVTCQLSLEERMACGTGACLGCAIKTTTGFKMVCRDGPIFNAGDIIW